MSAEDDLRLTRALVLGGTGMIGAHAVRACLRRGLKVRALVRPGSDLGNLRGLEIETAVGDLSDGESLAAGLRDCDLLIHAAAPYPARHFGKAQLLSRAGAGLATLLAAFRTHCQRSSSGSHPQRMVYVSSVTTIGIPADAAGRREPHPRPARETDRPLAGMSGAPYFAVKAMMEEAVLEAAGGGLPIVVVNPTFCVDALDSHCTTGQLLLPLARRQLPAYLPGLLNAVPTRDVGEGILLAALRGRVGQRYILGAENLTSREFLMRCGRVAGVPAPRIAMPLKLAEALSMVTEIWAYLTRTRPLFPLTGIRMMQHSQAYDINRARCELGYEPTSVDEAIERAYDWYRREGLL
jgi:dihydroflavonol-4-reductase